MADLVSIILATHNGAKYLGEQIESLLAQTHQNFEIIVSDDASSDSTLKIVEEYAAWEKRIRVFKNSGVKGANHNFLNALVHAQGEFICFCDQDDTWSPDKLERLLAMLKRDAGLMLVYSDLAVCDESLRITEPSFWQLSGIRPVRGKPDERVLLRNPAPGCSLMFRRGIKEKLSNLGLEIPFMHDHLVFSAASVMGRIDFTKHPLVKYRQHSANVIGASVSALFDEGEFTEQLNARIRFFKALFPHAAHFNYKRLENFVAGHSKKPRIFGNAADLKYYFFAQSRGLNFGLKGLIKCIFPGLYGALKHQYSGAKQP